MIRSTISWKAILLVPELSLLLINGLVEIFSSAGFTILDKFRIFSKTSSKISDWERFLAFLSLSSDEERIPSIIFWTLGHWFSNISFNVSVSLPFSPCFSLISNRSFLKSSFSNLVAWKFDKGPCTSLGAILKRSTQTLALFLDFDKAPASNKIHSLLKL